MNKNEQIKLAADLLNWSLEKAAKLYKNMENQNAAYFSDPSKGGASLIVSSEGSVLFADSSISPKEHIKAFEKGIRTPKEKFN